VKKKLKDETRAIPSALLDRADLEEILQLFNSIAENVKISDDEFEYDSIAELESKRGQTIRRLTIESESPSFSLTITKADTQLSRKGGATSVLAPYTQIRDLLKQRRRLFFHSFFNPFSALIILFGTIVVIVFFGAHMPVFMAFPLALVLVTPIILAPMHMSGAFTKILLVNRHEQQSFWTRNKDKIFLAIIVALITLFFSNLSWLIFRFR